jgi:NitT/TauT family transport system ATP-binding protein
MNEMASTRQLHASAAGAAPAVEVLSAEKTYPNGTQALMPVDLAIAEGEFVTLLGPSGCGKSTLLKMVAGLLEPSDGRLLLWRKPVQQLDESGRKMAFVFQSPTLMPWASVRTNVRLPLDLAGVKRVDAEARVADALALVGLSKFADALPRALSGGMQMRVSIARGLVTEPDLLLMDEPFGALDEITRHKLDADLLDLWRKKKLTVVFVTHSIHEAVFLSNRVVMMAARPGRVVQEFQINEPYPRTAQFMVSPQFSVYAKQLQDSLLMASGAQDDVAAV